MSRDNPIERYGIEIVTVNGKKFTHWFHYEVMRNRTMADYADKTKYKSATKVSR